MAVDWLKIKTEYINGALSQREIAAKYKVSPASVAIHCRDEGWVKEREKAKSKIIAKVQQKTEEKISDSESEANAIKARMKLDIFRQIEKRMGHADEMDGQDFRRIVQDYKDMCEIYDADTDAPHDCVNIIWDI